MICVNYFISKHIIMSLNGCRENYTFNLLFNVSVYETIDTYKSILRWQLFKSFKAININATLSTAVIKSSLLLLVVVVLVLLSYYRSV